MTWVRQPQASCLNARVDLAFRLINDPDGEIVKLEALPWSSVEVVRNRPAECDTAEVTLRAEALPFDLRVIAPKSLFVSVWLFEGDAPELCLDGAPGQFFGVVDFIERDRYTREVRLSSRDMAAVPLQATLPEGFVSRFEMKGLVSDLVLALIRELPGTQRWQVVDQAGPRPAPNVPLDVRPAPRKKKGAKKAAPPTGRGKVFLSAVVGEPQVSVWSAICAICARAGLVPEVRLGAGGTPEVVLVDAMELQRGDTLRPFQRGDRVWRVFVDGDGIAALNEHLEISGSTDRPDFVEVTSGTAGGAKAISARWPERPRAKDGRTDERGLLQYAPGVTSVEALRDMARSAFESLTSNQLRVRIEVTEPWSAGGGPHDPDLLELGFGALVELALPQLEVAGEGRTVEDVLRGQGVSAGLAQRLAAASERIGALALLFQVAEVRHQLGNGYRCILELRQALDPEAR